MKAANYIKFIFAVVFVVGFLTLTFAAQKNMTGASASRISTPKSSSEAAQNKNDDQSKPTAAPKNTMGKSNAAKAQILKPDIVVQSLTYTMPRGRKKGEAFKEGERTRITISFLNKGKGKSNKNNRYTVSCTGKGKGKKCPVKNQTKSIGKEIEPNETHKVFLSVILEKSGEYHVTVKVAGEKGSSQKTLVLKVVPAISRKFEKKPVSQLSNESSNKLTQQPMPSSKFKFQTFLSAKMFGGDFTKWVTDHKENTPEVVRFRWKTLKGANAEPFSFKWQVSTTSSFKKIIKEGSAGMVPESGEYQYFSIDFKKIAPPYTVPVTFYVRTVPGAESKLYTSSLPVTVTIIEAGEGTFFSTKGLYPELWNPVSIRISLNNFKIIQADEPGDEEPYIIAVAIYVDGTTIDLLKIGTSSIRIDATKQTHGNVRSTGIPGVWGLKVWEGPWNRTILPIGLEALDLAEKIYKQKAPSKELFLNNTFVIVLAAAMEEDASATSDINSLKNTFVGTLQKELNRAIKSIEVTLATSPSEIQGQVKDQFEVIIKNIENAMKNKIIEIVKGKLLTLPFSLGQLVDPDNFVGADYGMITLKQLMDQGTVNIPMDFNSCGDCDAHYKLTVSVKKKN